MASRLLIVVLCTLSAIGVYGYIPLAVNQIYKKSLLKGLKFIKDPSSTVRNLSNRPLYALSTPQESLKLDKKKFDWKSFWKTYWLVVRNQYHTISKGKEL